VDRLYLVTRADLPPGTQACQAAHAALDFAVTHPGVIRDWHLVSNTLVLLTARDELTLGWLCDDVAAAGHRIVRFHEPDLAGALTAAAFEPAARRFVAHLPLALNGATSRALNGATSLRDSRREVKP
jgi:hypothetical protein